MTAPGGLRLRYRTSATSCDGTCGPGSPRIGRSKPIRCAIRGAKTLSRSDGWKPSSPRRHGRRRQSLEWPDLALGRVRSDLAYAARNSVRQEGHPRGDDHPGLGRHLCRAGALPRPLGEAVRHRRQSREHPRPGLIFIKATESLGYTPFPMAAANSPNAYTNPDGMQLGQCQYCGHCERFICEANAKGSPEVLLYPMLRKRPGFELKLYSHVTGVDYDKKAKRVRGVRYLDLMSGEEYEQPADIVVLALFTMSNTKYLLMSGIGKPYDPKTGTGIVGKNFCHQTMSGVNVHFKDRWLNPFLAAGSSQTCIDEFNEDNFDHGGLGFFGGGYIYSNVTTGRPINHRLLPP